MTRMHKDGEPPVARSARGLRTRRRDGDARSTSPSAKRIGPSPLDAFTRFPSAGSAAVLIAAVLLAGCSSDASKTAQPPPAVPVTVAVARSQDVPIQVASIGNVESSSSVSVRSEVSGVLKSVGFRQGQNVRKGQVLFTIDARPYKASLDDALAKLGRDRVVATTAANDVVRYEDLARKNADYVTAQQMEKVRSDADSARQTVVSDEALVESARIQVGRATITAPISGRAGDVLVHAGNLVNPSDPQPLVILLQTRPVYVTFTVPERFLPEIRKASTGHTLAVTAALPNNPESSRKGDLSFVDNAVNTATGTIQLKATFPNEDEWLWPGQFVQVALTLGTQAGAVLVPSQAVQTGQQGTYIFVVSSDQTVESRPVEVSRTWQDQSILASGVAAGETVVTDGQLRLVPKARVDIKNKAEIAAAGARP